MGLFGRQKGVKRFYDYNMVFIIIFLALFGLLMVYSTSAYDATLKFRTPLRYVGRQAIIMGVGFVFMIVISKIDYHWYVRLAWLGYLLALALMILVNFSPLGIERNGKKRWLGLKGNESLSFQPTEFVKIALIVFLAYMIVRYARKIDTWRLQILLVALCTPIILLVTKNNLSSGIILFAIMGVMIFVASRKKLRFAIVVGGGLVVAILLVTNIDQLVKLGVLQEYQIGRIRTWQDPMAYYRTTGYQVMQGLYAIGSGGFFGKGLGASIQKLGFVPEAENDMIFSIICEELGIFGAVCVILMYLFLLWRFMVIANNAPDLMGSMLVVGVMAHIGLQVILNIAVVTNVIPNTGVTLPFISYGGTSMLFLMAEMGMVLGVSNRIILEAPEKRPAREPREQGEQ
ncbi:MAG: cell division protein FtsW [Lachnospiraceae bacterium]|nr:cell division protein FtsW [Lachnospiraceae bacterium]